MQYPLLKVVEVDLFDLVAFEHVFHGDVVQWLDLLHFANGLVQLC